MRREVVFFNKELFDAKMKALYRVQELVNRNTEILDKLGIQLTKDDLIDINKCRFNQRMYLKILESVCDDFGADFEQVRLFSYQIQNPTFSEIAHKKFKPVKELSDEIRIYCREIFNIYDCIVFEENKVSLIEDVEEIVKERCTLYTNSEKENKILELSKKMVGLYREFDNIGINRYKLKRLVNPVNGLLNIEVFKEICRE